MAIESDLSDRLAKATPKDSWRLCRELFNEDSSYLKSGLFNISAGWYPPGRSVSDHLFSVRIPAKSYISIGIMIPNRRHC